MGDLGMGRVVTDWGRGKRHQTTGPLPQVPHLDMLHQLWFLQEQEWALRALEDACLRLADILVKMLLNMPLLVEDHLTGALINEPNETSPRV